MATFIGIDKYNVGECNGPTIELRRTSVKVNIFNCSITDVSFHTFLLTMVVNHTCYISHW